MPSLFPLMHTIKTVSLPVDIVALIKQLETKTLVHEIEQRDLYVVKSNMHKDLDELCNALTHNRPDQAAEIARRLADQLNKTLAQPA